MVARADGAAGADGERRTRLSVSLRADYAQRELSLSLFLVGVDGVAERVARD